MAANGLFFRLVARQLAWRRADPFHYRTNTDNERKYDMAMDPVITLIKDDPEVVKRLIEAGSREERVAILAEYGVAAPDSTHVQAKMTELAAVTGGTWGDGQVATSAAAGAAAAF